MFYVESNIAQHQFNIEVQLGKWLLVIPNNSIACFKEEVVLILLIFIPWESPLYETDLGEAENFENVRFLIKSKNILILPYYISCSRKTLHFDLLIKCDAG